MARTFIAAVPLVLVLVAAVVVVAVGARGTFGFHSWPKAPSRAPRPQVVAIDAKVAAAIPARPRRSVAKPSRRPLPAAIAPSRQLALAPGPAQSRVPAHAHAPTAVEGSRQGVTAGTPAVASTPAAPAAPTAPQVPGPLPVVGASDIPLPPVELPKPDGTK